MSLRVWLPLDGTLKNNGVNDIPLDNNGATVDDSGIIGKCYLFNGSARISDTVARTYSYPLTCMCWFNANSISSSSNATHYIISVNQDTTGSAGHIIGFGFVSGKLNSFVGGTYNSYSTSLSTNTWYHCAVTIDVRGNWKMYLNGSVILSGTCGEPPASKWFTIGARCDSATGGAGGANYYFNGRINDVRLYDHALSEYEVKDISRGLVRHYKLDDVAYGQITDSSGYGYDSVTNDIDTLNTNTAKNTNCSRFDGTVHAEFPALPLSTKSISFWIKTDVKTITNTREIAFIDNGTHLSYGRNSSNNVYLSVVTKATGYALTSNGYDFTGWNHIVIVKPNDTTRTLYINGVLATSLSSKDKWDHTLTTLSVGCRYNGTYNGFLSGYMSDFRAYATELTQYDVSQLYEIGGKITKNVRLHANEMYEPEYEETTSAFADSNIIFIDNALERPIDDLHITFEPKVSGTGEPSEENIMNISGVQNGITLHQHGNNLCDWDYVADNVSLIPVTDSATRYGYIFDLPVGIYVVNAKWATDTRTSSSLYYKVKRADGTYDASHTLCSGTSLSTAIVTIDEGDVFFIYGSSTKSSTQTMFRRFLVNITSSNSSGKYGAWNPYKQNIINFAFPASDNTVYGGTLDVLEGSMSVKWELHTILSVSATDTKYSTYVVGAKGYIDGDLAGNSISNILKCYSSGTASTMPVGYFKAINSDGHNRAHICICFEGCRGSSSSETASLNNAKLSALNAAGTPLQVLIPLATPRTYQFDPKTIYTYAGVNTFYAVGAKVGVTYSVLDSVENSTVQVSKQSVANATGLYINPNLIQSNEIYVVNSAYLAYKLGLAHTLTKNATYTMQLWDVDVSNEGKTESELGVSVFLGGGSSRVLSFLGTDYFTNGHADYLCGTFKWTGTNSNAWLQVYNSAPDSGTTKSLSIGKWKLEEGSTPTPYMYDASNPLYSGVNHGFIEGELRDSTVSGKVFKGHYEFEEFEEH